MHNKVNSVKKQNTKNFKRYSHCKKFRLNFELRKIFLNAQNEIWRLKNFRNSQRQLYFYKTIEWKNLFEKPLK